MSGPHYLPGPPLSPAAPRPRIDLIELLKASQPTMLDHALELAAQARPVFPCAERQYTPAELNKKTPTEAKAPLTWRGFHDASMDPDQIKDWWTRWPTAMIGGPVPDDQTVIDLDPYHGGSLAELEAMTGPLPATLTAWSGRGDGGRHFYYQRPTGPLSSPRLPNGWDLRNGGKHYCILPPSIHPKTGQPYRWDEAPVAPMPDGLVELLRPKTVEYNRPAGLPTTGKLAGLLDRMGSETTNRNNVLFWCACRLWESNYPESAFQALEAVARATGLPQHEIDKAMKSAAKTSVGVVA